MSILMLGLDHQAPVETRERVAFLASERAADLAALLERPGLLEAVILSTCNRTELYAVCSDPGEGHETLVEYLSERKGLARAEVERHVTVMFEEEAAAHLFRVAAGLESQILGEGQILAQVKEALASAQAHRSCGALLDALFRHALTAGKRARSETGIAERNRSERATLIPEVEDILARELAAFLAWHQGYQVAPTIAAWRSKLTYLREQGLERFWLRHGGRFTDEQRRLVAEVVQGLFDKLSHGPLSRLKGMDGPRQRQLARALETLFGLDVAPGESLRHRRVERRR